MPPQNSIRSGSPKTTGKPITSLPATEYFLTMNRKEGEKRLLPVRFQWLYPGSF